MRTDEKIGILIETRINGNQIKGNGTYENMLKSLRGQDINSYCDGISDYLGITRIYKKIDKIEFMVNLIKEGK